MYFAHSLQSFVTEMDAQKPKTTSARPSLGAGAGHWPRSFCFATPGG